MINAAVRSYGVISRNCPLIRLVIFRAFHGHCLLSALISLLVQSELTTAALTAAFLTLQWQSKPDITDALVKILACWWKSTKGKVHPE